MLPLLPWSWRIRTETSFVEQVRALAAKYSVEHELLDQGLAELAEVIEEASRRAPGKVPADPSIARGLDYYTGTVYETVLAGHESLGSGFARAAVMSRWRRTVRRRTRAACLLV